jgi:hypothetical protein
VAGAALLLDHVYSFAFYSKYISFDQWETASLPVGKFQLVDYMGDMGMHVVMYALPAGEAVHRLSRRVVGADFEIVNARLAHFVTDPVATVRPARP